LVLPTDTGCSVGGGEFNSDFLIFSFSIPVAVFRLLRAKKSECREAVVLVNEDEDEEGSSSSAEVKTTVSLRYHLSLLRVRQLRRGSPHTQTHPQLCMPLISLK
jgi:hypothetical protein